MGKNLFYTIMEAEGDLLEPFDEGNDNSPTEESPPSDMDDNSDINEAIDDQPPEMNESDNLDDMSSESDDSGGSNDDSSEDEADKKDTNLSNKANNILNQQLYQKMINRNSEVEDILNNVKKLVPLLPYEVVQSNDKSINRLKKALFKGQQYVINNFVDSGYGVNLLFYQKLDSLYILLLDQIDSNLKKIKEK